MRLDGNRTGLLLHVRGVERVGLRIDSRILVFLTVTVVAIGLWLLSSRRSSGPAAEGRVRPAQELEGNAASASSSLHRPDAGAEIASRDAIEPEPVEEAGEPVTARGFLSEYWGDRWQDVEADMLAAGLDLDAPYVFHPWEEAAPVLEASMHLKGVEAEQQRMAIADWGEPTLDDLASRFRELHVPLAKLPKEEDLPALREIARPYNEELEVLSHQWIEGLDAAISAKWRSGDLVHAPFATYGSPGASDTGFFATASGALGWGALIVLKPEDQPYLMQLLERALELQDFRDEELRQYLVHR